MFYGLVILLALALIIFYAYTFAIDSPHRISSEEAKRLIQKGEIDVVLDVRTLFERRQIGFYPGSVHIQSTDLERLMPQLYPNKKIRILVYCNTGQRARIATEILHSLGYTNSVYIASHHKTLM